MCPCMIETDYIKMTDDWIIEESGYSAKELFDDIMSYGEFKKFASKSNCNGVAIFTNNFDTENEVRKYLKKIEKEINSDDELLYEMNYSFNKYNNVIINNAKYMFCGIINFEPKTPMKNFMISNGGLTKRNLRESAETIFDFCEDMNKMWKNYDVEFIANDGVEDSVTVLIGTNHPKMVAEYIYANHFRGVKYANVGVEKNKAMLIFYHFSEHSSNEIERLAFDAITDANIRYNLFEKSRKSARKSLKEKGLRYGVDTLEFIQDDIERYIQDNNLDIQIVDNGLAKAMDVMYIYDCKGKDMKKLKSGDLMDYLFSENGMLFHNLDFGVKVSPNQITISLPKTQDYVE